MTPAQPSLQPVELNQVEVLTRRETDDDDGQRSELERSPRWPVTKLAGLSLTLLLYLALAGPAVIVAFGGAAAPLPLLPGLVAAIAARFVFEGLERQGASPGIWRHVIPAICGAALATLLMGIGAALTGFAWPPAVAVATGGLATSVLLTAGALRDLEVRLRLALRRVFFVGSAAARRDLERELRRRRDASLAGAAPVVDRLETEHLICSVRQTQATVLVIDGDAMRLPPLVEAASRLNLEGIHVRDLVSYYESEFKKVPLEELTPTWFLFDIAPIHRRPLANALRRLVETVCAGIALVLVLPLLLVAGAAIRLTSPGPVLYRQRRVGRGGAQFTLLKLRTMVLAETRASWAPSQLHRITGPGRVLRRFRLDELPQLWNVIRGDLALIGPRPEQVPIAERLEREIPFYGARHCIRPGLTGWAQVNLGYAGSVEGTVAKLQRDLYYIKHACLRLDALIVWLTIRTVVTGRGG
jgi:lipopolysaccharide/colanic/teichoic acid biosynthesis glycosyltransferase